MSLQRDDLPTTAGLLQQIKLAFDAQKYPQVIAESLKAINNNKANQWIVRFLILAYHKTNQWDLAEPHCKYLKKEYPTFEHTKALLAETYQFSGRAEQAIPLWEAAIALNAKMITWQFRLAQCHHQLKHPSITINLLEKLLDKSEVLPEWMVVSSLNILLKYNQTQLIDLHLGKVATTNPQHFYIQASVSKIQEKWETAASFLNKAFQLNKRQYHWKIDQIQCLIKAKKLKTDWLPLVDELLTYKKLPVTILANIGDLLLRQKEYTKLDVVLVNINPVHFIYYELKARQMANQALWEEAIIHWQKACTLIESPPVWWYISMMNCYRHLNKKEEVAHIAASLLEKNQLTDKQLRQLFNLLLQNKLYLLAKEPITKVKEKEEALSMQANLCFKLEQYEKALLITQELLANKNVGEYILKNSYTLYLGIKIIQEEWQDVQDNAQQAIQQFPDFLPAYQRLLFVLDKTNQREKYESLMKEMYARFHDTHHQVIYHYSRFLELQGGKQISLELLESGAEKDKRLLIYLLQRHLRDGNLILFLQTFSSHEFSVKEKIRLLEYLVSTYIRLGAYKILPKLIAEIMAIDSTNYQERRLLTRAKISIIQFYEILNSPEVNISVLLSGDMRTAMKIAVRNTLDTLESRELVQDMLNTSLIRESPTKTVIINLYQTYLNKEQYAAKVWWNTYENPSQAFALANYLKERITKKNPTSFIRLGDGEGNYLSYPAYFQKEKEEDQKKIQYIWWRAVKLGKDAYAKEVIEKFNTAVLEADILGVIPERRLVNSLGCLQNGHLNHSFRGLFGVMHSTMHLPFKANVLTSCHIHTDFEMWDCYHYLLKDLEEISVISCHVGIKEYIKERFGVKKVHLYQVPSEQKYQQLFDYEKEGEHFPAIFQQLEQILSKKSKRQVFLVAAGFLSKIYCHIIKQHGGIGLDIGSVADQWMGYCTRTESELGQYIYGVRFNKQIGSAIDLPLKGQWVKTNHYCDRQLPIEKQPEIPAKIPFLVTGHPRTGTSYVSRFFASLECPIGHERLGAKGMSSWLHAVHNLNTPLFGKNNIGKYNISRYELAPEHLLLLVRDPKAAIPSILVENRINLSYNYRRFHILHERGIDLDDYDCYLEKAIVSYIEWIAIIEAQKPNAILRLEYLEEDVLRYFEEESISYNKAYDLSKIIKLNSTKQKYGIDKPVISKQAYLNINPVILKKLYDFCGKYGYGTDF